MNESEIPINNSFEDPDSHFEQSLQDIPKVFKNVKKSSFASKKIILLSNKRKILKRPMTDHKNFQKKDVRQSTVDFSKREQNFSKKDTIERLKQASTKELPKSHERDTHSNTQNYSIQFLEADDDFLDMSKIPELLHTNKDLKKLTFTDTGQTKGNYSFYAIKELDEEPNSSNRELSEEKKIKEKTNLSPPNNDYNWFAVSKFFNDDDDESRSSLGYDPEKEQHEKKSDKKSPEINRNADKKRENKERDYQYFQDFLHSTVNPTQEEIGNSIEENPNLKKEISDIPNLFRQQTKILHKRKPDFLKVIEMDEIEKLKYDFQHKTDRYPLKGIRKFILLFFR